MRFRDPACRSSCSAMQIGKPPLIVVEVRLAKLIGGGVAVSPLGGRRCSLACAIPPIGVSLVACIA